MTMILLDMGGGKDLSRLTSICADKTNVDIQSTDLSL